MKTYKTIYGFTVVILLLALIAVSCASFYVGLNYERYTQEIKNLR